MDTNEEHYILFVEYINTNNIVDFCNNLKIYVKEYNVDILYYIDNSIHHIIFNVKDFDKINTYQDLLQEYIDTLVKDIISHTEIHHKIKTEYIMDYIKTKMIEYEKIYIKTN